MGQNFSLYCGYRIGGVPMPLITWSYDNGLPIEPMLVGPDTSGAYYRYIPEMKEGNKTLKMVSTQMKKKQTEEISSREFELAKSFAGKVEKILKGSLDSIPSPSPSLKIPIIGGKVCLRCKGKTLLGIFNKLFTFKSLLTTPRNVLSLNI